MARILIDMDGVLADFVREAEKLGLTLDEAELTEGFFLNLPVIKDAVWGVATLTTVGYGDIYPVTTLGRTLGGVIAILGIGIFAIPTGIIASGFKEYIDKEESQG